MALPKTFVSGERLFASDLNDNNNYLETEIANAGPSFLTAGSDTVALDFSGDSIVTRSAAGNVTFTGANYTAGKSSTVRVVCDGSTRTLSFPAGWRWVSFEPSDIAANKAGVLTATCFGSSEADVVAAYSVEA